LAVSGAKHFAQKFFENPYYREEAMELVMIAPDLGKELQIPWAFENPVSVISSEWRPPDNMFSPNEFGGYLPEDDIHPEWPKYIEARDAYRKKTWIWHGNGFIWPKKKPVQWKEEKPGFNKQTQLLGGKSMKTKIIRSLTPRGFARAVFEANKSH
jgi:hypothetical protein